MSEQTPQSTKQEAHKTKPKTTIGEKLNSLLPWLRFGFNLLFCLVFMGVLIWGGYCLWENTKPSKEPLAIKELIQAIKENTKPTIAQRQLKENTKVEQEFKNQPPSYNRDPFWFSSTDSAKITIESTKEEDIPECYTIRMDDFENALKSVALVSRQEAAEDYHKSFSILVAILAVFGIGFPIIIALVQHSFNDRDLDKIEKTAIKVDEAIKQVDSLKTEAKQATEDATKAINNANKNLKENEKLKDEISTLSQALFDEISALDLLLTVPLKKEKNLFSLRVWLRFHAILNQIKKTEVEIRNDDLDDEMIKERLEKENNNINNIVKQLLSLNNDNAEVLSLETLYYNSKITLNNYKQILTKIKNNLPEELYDVIGKLKRTVQEALEKITDKEKTLPPEDNN